MKQAGIAIILAIWILFPCCQSTTKQENQEMFRRFCFAMKTDQAGSLEYPENLNMKVYRNDTMVFFILDTPADLDLAGLKKNITEFYAANNQSLPRSIQGISSGELAPLERIYKLEQEKVYSAEEGQLKTSLPLPCEQTVMSMELYPDPAMIEEYKEIHAIGKAWPEITANMKNTGILDMEIYILGTQTFLIMEKKKELSQAESEADWGEMPREQEWQDYVSKYQKTDPATGQKWVPMNKIY